MHAVVVRSTFPSHKCKKLRGTDHFWKMSFCVAGARDSAPCLRCHVLSVDSRYSVTVHVFDGWGGVGWGG